MSSHSHHPGHDHQHDHDHSHVPKVNQANQKKVLLSFVLIFTFMIVEFVGGVYAGSLALMADAGHMLTDAFALALAWAAFYFGQRQPNNRLTFGYIRFEVLASLFNAMTLFLIAIFIIYEAWQRLTAPATVMPWPMFIVACAGLLINLVVLWIMTRGETENVNIKGVILHVMGDLLGSFAAIVAAIVIGLTGWAPIDPILSVLVAVLILRGAWKLIRKTSHILLEGAPDDAAPSLISAHLLEHVSGLSEVSHIHVWQISTGYTLATLHIRAVEDTQAKQVVRAVENALQEKFAIGHSTIAIDWSDEPSSPQCLLSEVSHHHDCGETPHSPNHSH
ncbi:zinc transporter ZitB [bacteria symbiont BFo2 of Frankliniella occidentalis]|nr:zinc transporter ZitB [bacteria symbiont BFo2 of Frankliniella occidentalis]KYP90483.1 zinc transporter ZitB [bacteria symbiont BFo2 of Frankliniella occidentalis]KYP94640.1 zinc transporter ZitB [bacteria symbiont BFo2 of Frankliniella occidentalis]